MMTKDAKQQSQDRDYFNLLLNNPTNSVPLTTEQHSLLFASEVLHLVDILHNKPHDVDKLRFKLLSSLEHLVLGLASRGALTSYLPKSKTLPYKRAPQITKNLVIVTAKKIMAFNLIGG